MQGVMKLVGGVIGQSISTTRIPTIGVGNWGKTWKNHLLLHANRGDFGGVSCMLCSLVNRLIGYISRYFLSRNA